MAIKALRRHQSTDVSMLPGRSASLDSNPGTAPASNHYAMDNRRSNPGKSSLHKRRKCSCPYGLKRQSSLPVTQSDHICVTRATARTRGHSNENLPSNQTAVPTNQSASPSNNVIDLEAALQATSALATAPVVTRVPLYNSRATTWEPNNADVAEETVTEGAKHSNSPHASRTEHVTSATDNSDNNDANSLANAEYLRLVQLYGVLLRRMGDQLDIDYKNGYCERQQPSNQ